MAAALGGGAVETGQGGLIAGLSPDRRLGALQCVKDQLRISPQMLGLKGRNPKGPEAIRRSLI